MLWKSHCAQVGKDSNKANSPRIVKQQSTEHPFGES